MRPFRVFRTLSALFLSLSLSLVAQTYTPHSIVFTGTTLDQVTLTKLAAVTPGKPIIKAQIDAAMQAIVDTGLFADIRYTVDDRALNFIVTPQLTSAMLPAIYGNFVFWKPDELASLVHSRLPLFTGQVPTNGNLQQSIQDALATILLDNGIKANVNSILTQEKTVDFFIAQPSVQIRQVHIDSVSPIPGPRITEVLQSFAGTDFDRLSADAIHQRLVDTYHDLGFLDATIDLPHYDKPVAEPSHILVDFSTSVREGGQYHVSKLEWPDSSIVQKSDFEKAAQFRKGDVAARILLLATNAHVEAEFTRLGYLDAHVSVQARTDDSNHTVEYAFAVDPGEIYHLKSVKTANFTDQQQKDFDKNWKLPSGSVYDSSYASTFFQSRMSGSFQGFSPSIRATTNRNDHTVDLVITSVKKDVRQH
jgi:outer membrane protein assembly factor BamA